MTISCNLVNVFTTFPLLVILDPKKVNVDVGWMITGGTFLALGCVHCQTACANHTCFCIILV